MRWPDSMQQTRSLNNSLNPFGSIYCGTIVLHDFLVKCINLKRYNKNIKNEGK
jgi:hypothetical protein